MEREEELKTSELAKAAGVGTQTVRYYERVGLLPAPTRDRNGHRRWTSEHERRLRFIRRAQGHGFQLEEIRELLDLRIDEPGVCDDVADATDRVIVRVEQKIQELEQFRAALKSLRSACRQGRATGPCPILDALQETNDAHH